MDKSGVLACVTLLVLTTSCTQVVMRVAGFATPEYRDRFAHGTSFAVVGRPDSTAPTLDRQFTATITELLADRGFEIAPASRADFLVFFDYGTAASSTRRGSSPSSSGGSSRDVVVRTDPGTGQSRAKPTRATGASPGSIDWPRPDAQAESYDHYFRVLVVDASRYRTDVKSAALWRGAAKIANRSTRDPGQSDEEAVAILDALCVAAFEFFGESRDWTTIAYYDSD